MYHYCQRMTFTESLLTTNLKIFGETWRMEKLVNHILVCLLAEPTAPSLGLQSFVMPLRTSHFRRDHLRPIVLLGNANLLRREWPSLANLPEVYCLPGSPLLRSHLRTARIRFASVCVVLGSREMANPSEDPYMLDKEVILCSLNIRAMRFPPLSSSYLKRGVPNRHAGSEIPLITEINTDANIHYLDSDDKETGEKNIPSMLTAPFARGIAFTSSVLDVLASTAYFDRNAMTLIRHLVTGGITPDLEQWMAEGIEFYEDEQDEQVDNGDTLNINAGRKSQMLPKPMDNRDSARVAQISVTASCFKFRSSGKEGKLFCTTFGELFCRAIMEKGILCLGIFRNTMLEIEPLDSRDVSLLPRPSPTAVRNRDVNETAETRCKQRRLSTFSKPVDQLMRRCSERLRCEDLPETNPADIESDVAQTEQQQLNAQVWDTNNRYVITKPPHNFLLYRSDLIFCLCPFEHRE